jgi:hypothetical protein
LDRSAYRLLYFGFLLGLFFYLNVSAVGSLCLPPALFWILRWLILLPERFSSWITAYCLLYFGFLLGFFFYLNMEET